MLNQTDPQVKRLKAIIDNAMKLKAKKDYYKILVCHRDKPYCYSDG
jgi:hypothetical protein